MAQVLRNTLDQMRVQATKLSIEIFREPSPRPSSFLCSSFHESHMHTRCTRTTAICSPRSPPAYGSRASHYKVDRHDTSVNPGIDLASQVMDSNKAPLQDDHLEYLPPGREQDKDSTAPTSPVAPTPKAPPARVEPTNPAPTTIVEPPQQAPNTIVEPTHPAPTTPVERPQMSNQQAMATKTPQLDTKMQGHLPTLASDGTNYQIWKQTLYDIAIINNIEAALDESSPSPTVTSPYYSIYRRKCAFLRMSIMTSLPTELVSTIDTDLSVTPQQLLAEIQKQFTDSTPTTHLILKQEAQRTKIRAGGDLEEYIAAHRTIRTKMCLAA